MIRQWLKYENNRTTLIISFRVATFFPVLFDFRLPPYPSQTLPPSLPQPSPSPSPSLPQPPPHSLLTSTGPLTRRRPSPLPSAPGTTCPPTSPTGSGSRSRQPTRARSTGGSASETYGAGVPAGTPTGPTLSDLSAWSEKRSRRSSYSRNSSSMKTDW